MEVPSSLARRFHLLIIKKESKAFISPKLSSALGNFNSDLKPYSLAFFLFYKNLPSFLNILISEWFPCSPRNMPLCQVGSLLQPRSSQPFWSPSSTSASCPRPAPAQPAAPPARLCGCSSHCEALPEDSKEKKKKKENKRRLESVELPFNMHRWARRKMNSNSKQSKTQKFPFY